MQWFNNFKIRTRLLAGFILVAFIAGIIGFIGIQQIRKIDERDTLLYEKMTVPISQLTKMSTFFQQVRVNTRDIIIAQEPEEIENCAEKINQHRKELSQELEAFEKLIMSQEVRTAFNHLQDIRQEYGTCLEKLIGMARANQDKEAYDFLNGNMRKVEEAEREALEKLTQLKVTHAKETAAANEAITDSATFQMLVTLVIGMVLAISLGLFISRGISKPVNTLRYQLDELAEKGGDLTQEIKIAAKDEIGGLAQAVNKFIANLRIIMLEVNKNAQGLSSTAQQLTSSAEQTASGANETSATMTEISAAVEEVAKTVQDIGKVAEDNAHMASEGNKSLISFNKDMSEIDKATKLVASVIEDLNQKALNINKIVEAITGIADQTNLLALNAAIEAARAGEAGKGFAVVAEEVRKLAEECSKSAKHIKDLIKTMQDKAAEAVQHVTNSSSMVFIGMDKSIEIGAIFQRIVDSIDGMGTQFESLIAATEEMSAGVQNVAASTEEQTAATEEVSAAAESLSNLAVNINDVIGKFKV